MSNIYLLMFLLLGVSEVNGACCPNGWTRFDDSCYIVITTPATWSGGGTTCQALGGHLAYIETAYENSFIKAFLKSFAVVGVWVGGTDMVEEGVWRWEATGPKIQYTDWAPGEPSNVNGEDCLVLQEHKGLQWDDAPCSFQYGVMCEIVETSTPIAG